MFKPELSEKMNAKPRRDASRVLEKYRHKIKWGNDDRIIDLGCGDGGLTVHVLKKFLPSNYKMLIGCDISETMIKFANENRSDERTKFNVFDMSGDLPEEWRNAYDLVFSSYAIHWVQQPEKVFSNIFDLLSERGDVLLLFVGQLPTFDVYRKLARLEKWRSYLRDVELFISPYQDITQEPSKRIQKLMADIGFKNIEVQHIKENYDYSKIDFRNLIEAICPFKIPSDLMEEYMKDFIQEIRKMGLFQHEEDNNLITLPYGLYTVYGSKY